jgi:hypothetical protein
MKNLFRVIFFQTFWFIFIKYSEFPYAWMFPLTALFFVTIDKVLFYKKQSWTKFIQFSVFIFIAGLLVDSSLLNFKMMKFDGWNSPYSPPYMWAIWIIFIPYYEFAFPKFYGKLWLALALGLFCAPLSYMGGAKIGTLSLTQSYSQIVIGVFWAVFFPLSVAIYKKLNNTSEEL